MAAVEAHPAARSIRNEQLSALQQVCIGPEAVAVELFNGGDLLEGGRYGAKTLLAGGLPEGLIHGIVFFVFVALGAAQQFRHVMGQVHRVSARRSGRCRR